MDRTVAVMDAVRRIDALEAERQRLTRDLDARIAEAKVQLAELIGEQPSNRRKKPARRSPVGDIIVAGLQENPGIDYGVLAVRAYGKDTPDNRHRVRAQLHNLKTSGRIRRDGSSGAWEVMLKNGAAGGLMHS